MKMICNEVDQNATLFPKWLTPGYIQNVLQNYKQNKYIKVINLELKPAIGKGENFASVLTRLRLTYEENYEGASHQHIVSYIVKSNPTNTDTQISSIYRSYQVFETEMTFYEKVLPKLKDLLKKIGEMEKLFADIIYVDYENEAIIFEDLVASNFGVADRLRGMDLMHAKMTLQKLAKFHAITAVLNEETDGFLEQFTYGILNRHTAGFGCVFQNIIGVCAEFAGACEELGVYYKDKLLKLKDHVVEYGTRTFDLREGNFHTLNHGDFWINNIMVQYNVDEPVKSKHKEESKSNITEIVLIDFQLCTWTSPTTDLHYFFNTSLEGELRLNNQDELVQYYHGILKGTLLKLNYAGHIPSLHEFCVQMEETRFYAVLSALVAQTFQINDNTEGADAQALILDDVCGRNFRSMLYRNKVVQDNAKKLLPFFDRRGLLDVQQ